MDFATSLRTCLTDKFFVCSDRAPRSEYWWFFLASTVISTMAAVFDAELFPLQNQEGYGPANFAWSIFSFIPSFCVMIRRLHDTNRSGWWWLIVFTIIGIIPFLFWMVRKGTTGPNRFGPDPLAPQMIG